MLSATYMYKTKGKMLKIKHFTLYIMGCSSFTTGFTQIALSFFQPQRPPKPHGIRPYLPQLPPQ